MHTIKQGLPIWKGWGQEVKLLEGAWRNKASQVLLATKWATTKPMHFHGGLQEVLRPNLETQPQSHCVTGKFTFQVLHGVHDPTPQTSPGSSRQRTFFFIDSVGFIDTPFYVRTTCVSTKCFSHTTDLFPAYHIYNL